MSCVGRASARTGEVCPSEVGSELGPVPGGWERLAGLLARALVNDWSEQAYMPLVRLVGDPLTVGSEVAGGCGS